MDETRAAQGAKRAVDGQWRVFYDGYWIKAYDAPADTPLAQLFLSILQLGGSKTTTFGQGGTMPLPNLVS